MKRAELAKEVQKKGIKTEKNPFFMKTADLAALLANAPTKKKKKKFTGSKDKSGIRRATIMKLVNSGKTRKEVVAEMNKLGLETTLGYVNSVVFHEKLKAKDARRKAAAAKKK